jgi:PAS domain S-box-containing protein
MPQESPLAELSLFRLLFERSVDAHLLLAGDTLLDCNQAALDLLGYAAKPELLMLSLSALSSNPQPDGRSPAIHVEEISRLVAIQGSHRFEWMHRRADGSTVSVEVSLTEIDIGQQVIAHAVLRDITRRRRQEAAIQAGHDQLATLNTDLRRSRDALDALFDGFDDGLLLLDSAGRIVSVNRAFANLLGSERAALIGRRWANVVRRVAPGFPLSIVRATLRDGQTRRERARFTANVERVFVLDLQTFPLGGSDGTRPEQVVLRVTDLTERLQLEALAVQHERFAANARLAAAVAHEIKSPLQAIQTLLYLAQGDASATSVAYLNLASEEILRLGQVAGRLLDHYRPGASTMVELDVNMLVERVLLLTGPVLNQAQVIVRRELGVALPSTSGRLDQLTQVLLNLVFNAADAMPVGGVIQLRTLAVNDADPYLADIYWAPTESGAGAEAPLPTGSFLAIVISDEGSGIAPELLSRLFTPFFTTKPDGVGLGLAISRRIVAQHAGHIGVRSTPERGTSFWVLLPTRNMLVPS